jgi:membrane-associated phospholipid phosphatase
MPSGHAVVFFAFGLGLFSISRTLGILGVAHAVLVDALPRMYLGLHYPTDVLAGALVPVAVVAVLRLALEGGALTRALLAWSKRRRSTSSSS